MTDKINIELEEWQVRTLRSYFGQNDETQVAHWAFKVFDEALKQQCDIPVVTTRLKIGTKVCKNKKTKIGVIDSKSDFGFNYWIVEWDGGEFTREYGIDLNVW